MSRWNPPRRCPECEGGGVIEIRLDVEMRCDCCGGDGSLESTHERYAEATRWPRHRFDPLLAMRSNRAHYLIQKRTPWGAASHPYISERRRAMAFVDLPLDDAHLLVSPETAAYFNAMTRRAA